VLKEQAQAAMVHPQAQIPQASKATRLTSLASKKPMPFSFFPPFLFVQAMLVVPGRKDENIATIQDISLLAGDHIFSPNWMIIAPHVMTINPIQVVFGMFSSNTKRPNNMLTIAKTAT
jgi:hypothetical protein